MAEYEFDFTPYAVQALAKIDAMAEERLKDHFRQAFMAGAAHAEGRGADSFEEWLDDYVERLKRDGVRSQEG